MAFQPLASASRPSNEVQTIATAQTNINDLLGTNYADCAIHEC
jgi:hypothetical protein